MGERIRTLAIVVCLVLLATILAGLNAGSAPPNTKVTIQEVPSTGTILVRVGMYQGTGNTSVEVPVVNASVTIIRSSGSVTPLVFQTNSSGEFEISIGTGSYGVVVSDAQFRNGTNVEVQQNRTTEVHAIVTGHSYPALSSYLPNTGSSGSAAPWSYIYVALNASQDILMNGRLFIEGYYSLPVFSLISGSSGNLSLGVAQSQFNIAEALQGLAVPVTLISSYPDASTGSHVVWLILQPQSFFRLSGLLYLSLETYTDILQVTTYAS